MASNITNASNGMSAEEVEMLTWAGFNIKLNFMIMVAQVLAYGAYVVLAVIAVAMLSKRPRKSVEGWALLLMLCVTFIFITLETSFGLVMAFSKVQKYLIDNSDLPYPNRLEAYGMQSWLNWSGPIMILVGNGGDVGLLFLINDVLAVWRAFAVLRCGIRSVVGIILSVLVVITTGIFIPITVIQILDYHRPFYPGTSIIAVLGVTGSVVSITTNLVATGMMAHAAYTYRSLENTSGLRLSSGRILVFLTESGAFYAIIQITRLGLSLAPGTTEYTSMRYGSSVFLSMSLVMTAMYTPAVMIIINCGFSISNTIQMTSFSSSDETPPYRGSVSNIVFGRGTARSSMVGPTASEHTTVQHDLRGRMSEDDVTIQGEKSV